MVPVARSSLRLRVTLSAGLHGSPIHPTGSAGSYRLAAIGRTGVHLYDRISQKPAASLTTKWGDDRVVAVLSDPVR
jgi:hypothetical protein